MATSTHGFATARSIETGLTGRPAPPSAVRRRWRIQLMLRNPLVVGGLVLVVFFCAVAVMAGELTPVDPTAMNTARVLEAPSLAAPFGTDRFGRDVLSRAMYGARSSLIVGVGSIVIAATVGSVVGLLSGYFGGRLDNALGRVMEVFL